MPPVRQQAVLPQCYRGVGGHRRPDAPADSCQLRPGDYRSLESTGASQFFSSLDHPVNNLERQSAGARFRRAEINPAAGEYEADQSQGPGIRNGQAYLII